MKISLKPSYIQEKDRPRFRSRSRGRRWREGRGPICIPASIGSAGIFTQHRGSAGIFTSVQHK